MDITLSLLAFALSILGIIGCIVPALPGVVLSYAGLLCAYFTSYSQMSASALWLWLGVTVAVSVADYFLPAWMTRRFGGSRAGAIGATVGVGATLHDAGDSYTSWAMEAAVGTAARRIPDKDSLHTVAVTSRGNPRSKEEAFAGLEDALCRAILESIRVW